MLSAEVSIWCAQFHWESDEEVRVSAPARTVKRTMVEFKERKALRGTLRKSRVSSGSTGNQRMREDSLQ